MIYSLFVKQGIDIHMIHSFSSGYGCVQLLWAHSYAYLHVMNDIHLVKCVDVCTIGLVWCVIAVSCILYKNLWICTGMLMLFVLTFLWSGIEFVGKLQIVEEWFELLKKRFRENPDSCVAVHCVAGLGRAPVMVALALIELGMKYEDAVDFIRQWVP
jgi:hypothetical protein